MRAVVLNWRAPEHSRVGEKREKERCKMNAKLATSLFVTCAEAERLYLYIDFLLWATEKSKLFRYSVIAATASK